MSTSLKILRRKVTDASFQLVNHVPNCTLCQVKLPSQSNYDSHMSGKIHRSKANQVLKNLMNAVFSSGIVLKEDHTDNTGIYCILCEQQVSSLFDSNFQDHINSDAHQSKLKGQKDKERNVATSDPYKISFAAVKEEDVFIKGVSRAGIIVSEDSFYRCVPCNNQFSGKQQFLAHVKGVIHREWVFNQLSKMLDRIGLSLGIIVENGSLQCKLCNCQLGSGLATADAYLHVNSVDPNDVHKANVLKQISGGLDTYYDDEDSDDFDTDIDDFFFDDEDDLSFEYELQAPWWDSEDRDMEYYMALDAAYNDDFDDYY